MMPIVQLWINEKEVWAEEGSNLLEAALAAGIHIPHFCHDPRLKPFGSCRMCFVEVEGGRGPVPSCGNVVKEGMRVYTETAQVHALRKAALELMLAEHCGDCIAPCQIACPAEIDIQGFIAHIANLRYDAAAALIMEKLPLPSVCGRVCPRFCEQECRRNVVDEAVDICTLKRFAGDFALSRPQAVTPLAAPSTGRHVAVVGGGPAGLTAAYYLALAGHAVTIYDAGPELGGMLRYGIPEYRLPKDTLDQEIHAITALCHEVRLGQVLGRDLSLDELREQFDAVFVGLGCQAAQGLGLEQENTAGILTGIGFLREVAEGRTPVLGENVAVVGGGNTAMDAARTAVRLGARQVNVVYRRSLDEMPASPEEIREAGEEGVQFLFLTNPQGYLCENGSISGLECIRMFLGEPDASGRRQPVAVKGTEFCVEADTVILAIGQSLEKSTGQTCGLGLTGRGYVSADSNTGATTVSGVFSAGDCVTGPATVVQAVAAARKTAYAMNLFLQGKEIHPEPKPFNCSMGELADMNPADFAEREKLARTNVSHLPIRERKTHFKEYNLGFTPEGANQETNRCLSCGCQDVFTCQLRQAAEEYGVDINRLGTAKKRYPIKRDHKYVHQDANKCILCGSCVRICQEVMDISALGFVNRGFDTAVQPSLGVPLAETLCESCGQCISVCPTGALASRSPLKKPGPWRDQQVVDSTCVRCSTGCSLKLHVAAGHITRVSSPLRNSINDGNLCKRGSFKFKFAQGENRLKTPLIRDGEQLKEASWEKALAVAGGLLEKIGAWQGSGSLAVLVSPDLSNEENYLAQKLARLVMRTNHVESTRPVHIDIDQDYSKPDSMRVTFADVGNSDFILVVNTDLTVDFPILARNVRQAVADGSTLAIINQLPTRLDKNAAYSMHVNPRKTLNLLQALHGYLHRYGLLREGANAPYTDEDIKNMILEIPDTIRVRPGKAIEMLHRFLAAKNPVVIVDGDTLGVEEQSVLNQIAWGAEKTGNGYGVLTMYRGGNARGQLDMGVHPLLLPGRRSVNDIHARERYCSLKKSPLPLQPGCNLSQITEKIRKGDILGVLVIGDDYELHPDIFTDETFVVAMASTWRKDLERADVVLPAATFYETSGTVVNSEGRICKLNPAFAPPAGKQNIDILHELATCMGSPLTVLDVEQLFSESQKVAGWSLCKEGEFFTGGEHRKSGCVCRLRRC